MKEYLNKFKEGYRKFADSFLSFIEKHFLLILLIVITIGALAIRYLSALHPTNDMVGYILNGWMSDIQEVGFFKFYTIDADYSPLFLFFIAIISMIPGGDMVSINGYTFHPVHMYLLKSVYFLTDVLSALAIYLILYHILKDKIKSTLGYCIFLILPAQFTNSALWGNCDSVYVCFFLYAIYFLLKRKDYLVWYFFGLALSLKMQSIFLLPFLIYLCLSKRLKFYPIIMAVLAILLSFLPSYCCGASFTQPFSYFSRQVNGYSNVTLGCANFWHFFGVTNMDSSSEPFNKASTWIGLVLITFFCAVIYLRKIKLTDENILYVATFLISIVPYFLPHMHERYFYILDVLVVVYSLLSHKKRHYLILLMQLSSFIAYYHYMMDFSKYFIDVLGEDSVTLAAIINTLVLSIVFYDLMKLEHDDLLPKKAKEQKPEISKETFTDEKITGKSCQSETN
jgi:Gpi18-like mannosyltransferase